MIVKRHHVPFIVKHHTSKIRKIHEMIFNSQVATKSKTKKKKNYE